MTPTLSQMADLVGEAAGHYSHDSVGNFRPARHSFDTLEIRSPNCPGCRAWAEAMKHLEAAYNIGMKDGAYGVHG